MDNLCKRCNRQIKFSAGTTQQYHIMCRKKSSNDRRIQRQRLTDKR